MHISTVRSHNNQTIPQMRGMVCFVNANSQISIRQTRVIPPF